MLSVVAGMMLAKRLQGKTGAVGVACIGDGTTSVGATHEACNLIAVEKLPVVVVVTNNRYAYSTPNSEEFACADLTDRGKGYGMRTYSCDGTDFLQTLSIMQQAVQSARNGDGAQWVVATTLRMCGHGEHDDAAYISAELREEYAQKDPLDVARRQILGKGWLSEQEADEMNAVAQDDVQRALAQSQREDTPVSRTMDWRATSWNPQEA